jgi:hypothetical protein
MVRRADAMTGPPAKLTAEMIVKAGAIARGEVVPMRSVPRPNSEATRQMLNAIGRRLAIEDKARTSWWAATDDDEHYVYAVAL